MSDVRKFYQEVVPGTSDGLVSKSGLKGRSDNTAVATGYVGEKVAGSISSFNLTLAANNTIGSISLNPGIYLVYGAPVFGHSGNAITAWSARTAPFLDVSISTTSGTIDNSAHTKQTVTGTSAGTFEEIWLAPTIRYVTVPSGSPVTYYLVVFPLISSSPTLAISASTQLYAVRIA
jgi:hypothetical protein